MQEVTRRANSYVYWLPLPILRVAIQKGISTSFPYYVRNSKWRFFYRQLMHGHPRDFGTVSTLEMT